MDPIYQNIRSKIQKFQFYKLRKLSKHNQIDTAYFLMGNSRTGKTSLFLLLQDIKLESVLIDGQVKIDVKDQKMKQNDYIGHGGVSRTKMPNITFLKDLNSYLIDCPGLLDSQGFQDDFTNQYFIMRVFQLVKKARYLLCISQNDLRNDNKNNIGIVISGFLKYFNDAEVKFQQIFKNTSIIITKKKQVSGILGSLRKLQEKQREVIKKIAFGIAQFFKDKNKQNHSSLLQNVFQNERFYFFYQPDQVNQTAKCDPILSVESKRNEFYQMNFKTDINYKFDSNEQSEKSKELIPKIDQMYGQIIHKISEICSILTKLILQVSENVSKPNISQRSFQYRKQISEYVFKNDIYVSNQKLQQRKDILKIANFQIPSWQNDFADIRFLKKIKNHYQQCSQTDLQSLIESILYQIFKFCYLDAKHDQLYNLAYISKNLFEQLKIIKRVIDNQNFSTFSQPYSLIKLPFNIRQKEIDFVMRFQINDTYSQQNGQSVIRFFQNEIDCRKSLKDLYLHEHLLNSAFSKSSSQLMKEQQIDEPSFMQKPVITQFSIKKQIQSDIQLIKQKSELNLKEKSNIDQNLDFKTVAKLKIMEKKIISIITKVWQKLQKYDKAYRYLSTQRKLQIQYQSSIKEYRDFTPDQVLYKWLAKLSVQRFNNHFLAIEYYKVIRFEHKVRKMFKIILKNCKTHSEKLNVLITEAQFLSSICDSSQAKKSLQQAFQYSKGDSQKIQILNMIEQIFRNEDQVKQKYQKDILQHKFYKIPNNTQIEKLQKQSKLI